MWMGRGLFIAKFVSAQHWTEDFSTGAVIKVIIKAAPCQLWCWEQPIVATVVGEPRVAAAGLPIPGLVFKFPVTDAGSLPTWQLPGWSSMHEAGELSRPYVRA